MAQRDRQRSLDGNIVAMLVFGLFFIGLTEELVLVRSSMLSIITLRWRTRLSLLAIDGAWHCESPTDELSLTTSAPSHSHMRVRTQQVPTCFERSSMMPERSFQSHTCLTAVQTKIPRARVLAAPLRSSHQTLSPTLGTAVCTRTGAR